MSETAAAKSFQLRQLGKFDAIAYRALRLKALRSTPEAFSADWEDVASRSISEFVQRLEQNVVFGAFTNDGSLIGIVGFRISYGPKTKHKGLLWGMFVHPDGRGTGLAAALLNRVIEHAKVCVEELQLSVVATNPAAIKLYSRFGFQQYGLERRALKVDDRYFDDILMALQF